MRAARKVVIFTGAGISTSAALPDYRGPQGVWTRHGIVPAGSKPLDQALPTYAHYAIAELLRCGRAVYVISTNLDGLHRRSGLSADQISELHGNCYREKCVRCDREYLRPFNVLETRHDRSDSLPKLSPSDPQATEWNEWLAVGRI